MADDANYDYPIQPAYKELDTGAFDKSHREAGVNIIGHKVLDSNGKPQTSIQGTLYGMPDGTKYWVKNSGEGRFYRQRLQAGVPSATPEQVSPNNQGETLRGYEKELTDNPFNPFLKSTNNPNPAWYTDANGKPIPANKMTPGQLTNAHQILEEFTKQNKHDVSGISNVFTHNTNAIRTLEQIEAIQNDKSLGPDGVGELQRYANGALNWSRMTDTDRKGYPDQHKLALANRYITLVRQAREEIAGVDAASAQDKGANLASTAGTALSNMESFLPGIILPITKGVGTGIEQAPSNVNVVGFASVIDQMKNRLKQDGVKAMMDFTRTGEYPISPQLRAQYDIFGHQLHDLGIGYNDNPADKSVDYSEGSAKQPAAKSSATPSTTPSATPSATPSDGQQKPGQDVKQESKPASAGDVGKVITTVAPSTETLVHPTLPKEEQSAEVNAAEAKKEGKYRPEAASVSEVPGKIQEGAETIGRTPIAKFLNSIPPPPGYDLVNKGINWLFTPQNVNAPAYTAPPTWGAPKPQQTALSPDLAERVRSGQITEEAARGIQAARGQGQPRPAPTGTPAGTSQNQLPSNAEAGAPLGAPDNRVQIPRLVHQQHVDALEPGTPFYWADHPDAYVKV